MAGRQGLDGKVVQGGRTVRAEVRRLAVPSGAVSRCGQLKPQRRGAMACEGEKEKEEGSVGSSVVKGRVAGQCVGRVTGDPIGSPAPSPITLSLFLYSVPDSLQPSLCGFRVATCPKHN